MKSLSPVIDIISICISVTCKNEEIEIVTKRFSAIICRPDCFKVMLTCKPRLTPVLKTNFHLCVMSYTCSQSNSDGSVKNNGHQS